MYQLQNTKYNTPTRHANYCSHGILNIDISLHTRSLYLLLARRGDILDGFSQTFIASDVDGSYSSLHQQQNNNRQKWIISDVNVHR